MTPDPSTLCSKCGQPAHVLNIGFLRNEYEPIVQCYSCGDNRRLTVDVEGEKMTVPMPTDLKPCPSCKCNMAQTESRCPPLRGWALKRVVCNNCKLKGPWCETFEMAIYRWNAMSDPLTDEQKLAIFDRCLKAAELADYTGQQFTKASLRQYKLACFEEPDQ